jgi:hypothetical protein
MYTLFLRCGVLFLFACVAAHAQWNADPSQNNVIAATSDYENNPVITTDGSEGAIIAWENLSNFSKYNLHDGVSLGNPSKIVARRINAGGALQWSGPVDLSPSISISQENAAIVSDGSGGAIVVWQDYRYSGLDIAVQKIDGAGNIVWDSSGVAICTTANDQKNPKIVSDGEGGAIIVWEDQRAGSFNTDIYAQRITASGVVQWGTNGGSVCTNLAEQLNPVLIEDDSGGAIITWEDYRSGFAQKSTGGSSADIYAQRVNLNGVVQWQADGIAVNAESNEQSAPQIARDESGGAVIVWQDFRFSNYDIYSQRIDRSGNLLWTSDGARVNSISHSLGKESLTDNSVGGSDQIEPRVVSDDSGGAIVMWRDYRGGSVAALFAQRVNSLGNTLWNANDVEISAGSFNDHYDHTMIEDGAHGALMAWTWVNNFVANGQTSSGGGGPDISAQGVYPNGLVYWEGDANVSTATGNQTHAHMTLSGTSSTIIVWDDGRNFAEGDVYGSKLFPDGSLPIQLTAFTASVVEGNKVQLEWTTASEINNYGFYVERKAEGEANFTELPNSFVKGAGTTLEEQHYSWTDKEVTPGRYFYRLRQVDLNGDFAYSHEIRVVVSGVVGVWDDGLPFEFKLLQNFPNPFNPSTQIRYAIKDAGFVVLNVYNVLGQEVVTLVNERKEPGRYTARFDAGTLSSGIYVYRLTSGTESAVKNMLLVK